MSSLVFSSPVIIILFRAGYGDVGGRGPNSITSYFDWLELAGRKPTLAQ